MFRRVKVLTFSVISGPPLTRPRSQRRRQHAGAPVIAWHSLHAECQRGISLAEIPPVPALHEVPRPRHPLMPNLPFRSQIRPPRRACRFSRGSAPIWRTSFSLHLSVSPCRFQHTASSCLHGHEDLPVQCGRKSGAPQRLLPPHIDSSAAVWRRRGGCGLKGAKRK